MSVRHEENQVVSIRKPLIWVVVLTATCSWSPARPRLFASANPSPTPLKSPKMEICCGSSTGSSVPEEGYLLKELFARIPAWLHVLPARLAASG